MRKQPVARRHALLNAARARPTLFACAGIESSGLALLDWPLAAAQHEPVVSGGRRVPVEAVTLRDGDDVVAARRELQRARAFELHRRPLRIGVMLREQDPELVARPPRSVLAIPVLLEIQVLAGRARIGRARL